MCGRFTLTVSPEDLQAAFPDFHIPGDIPPSYNIAPSQPIPVIPNDGKNSLDFYSWGLIPSWTKADNVGKYNLINARSETAAENKGEVFQHLFKPFPDEEMQTYPVSPFVNSPRNNSPQCIQASSLL